MEEMRLARNGSPYTWKQFNDWYGPEAGTYWDEATPVSLRALSEDYSGNAMHVPQTDRMGKNTKMSVEVKVTVKVNIKVRWE